MWSWWWWRCHWSKCQSDGCWGHKRGRTVESHSAKRPPLSVFRRAAGFGLFDPRIWAYRLCLDVSIVWVEELAALFTLSLALLLSWAFPLSWLWRPTVLKCSGKTSCAHICSGPPILHPERPLGHWLPLILGKSFLILAESETIFLHAFLRS